MLARKTNNKAAFRNAPTTPRLYLLKRYDQHEKKSGIWKEMLSKRLFKIKELKPTNPEEGC